MNISLLFNISSDDRFSAILSIKIEKTTINQKKLFFYPAVVKINTKQLINHFTIVFFKKLKLLSIRK